jgi:hypothetical protein
MSTLFTRLRSGSHDQLHQIVDCLPSSQGSRPQMLIVNLKHEEDSKEGPSS